MRSWQDCWLVGHWNEVKQGCLWAKIIGCNMEPVVSAVWPEAWIYEGTSFHVGSSFDHRLIIAWFIVWLSFDHGSMIRVDAQWPSGPSAGQTWAERSRPGLAVAQLDPTVLCFVFRTCSIWWSKGSQWCPVATSSGLHNSWFDGHELLSQYATMNTMTPQYACHSLSSWPRHLWRSAFQPPPLQNTKTIRNYPKCFFIVHARTFSGTSKILHREF